MLIGRTSRLIHILLLLLPGDLRKYIILVTIMAYTHCVYYKILLKGTNFNYSIGNNQSHVS